MTIEKKIAICCAIFVMVVIVLGVIDTQPQVLSQDEFWKDCHLTETC